MIKSKYRLVHELDQAEIKSIYERTKTRISELGMTRKSQQNYNRSTFITDKLINDNELVLKFVGNFITDREFVSQ